jgi:hypothetical protein
MKRNKYSFKLFEEEFKRLKYLTKLFYLLGCIPKQSISDALRYMIDKMIEEIEYKEEIEKLKRYYNNFLNKF